MKESRLPMQLNELVKQSTFTDLSKAEQIAFNYAPLFEKVNVQIAILKTLKKGDINDLEKAKRVRLDLGIICSEAASQKKTDKDLLLVRSRFIDGLFKSVEGAARITQKEAKEIENHFEIIEQKRKEDLQNSRVLLLTKFIDNAEEIDLSGMDEDVWNAYLSTKEKNYNDKIEAEKVVEQERRAKIEADKKEQERIKKENAELKKQADIKAKKDAADELERNRLEKVRLDKEAKERKDRKDAEVKRQQELVKERKDFEDEKNRIKKIADDKQKGLEKQIQDKEDAEAKAEKERLDTIQAELNKGDADKIKDLLKDLEDLTTKYVFKSEKNKQNYKEVGLLLGKVSRHITRS